MVAECGECGEKKFSLIQYFPGSIEIKSSSKTKTPQTALENLPHKINF